MLRRTFYLSTIIYCTLLILTASALYAEPTSSTTATNFVYIPPPTIDLNQAEQNLLRRGKRVIKDYQDNLKTHKVVIFRVTASKQQIWQVITNYDSYPQWVKGVKYTNVYNQDAQNYYVEFVVGHWLLGKFNYFVWHYLADDSWMKWQLDKTKNSDFSISTGFWQVIEAPDEPGKHDVYYSADLTFKPPKSASIRRKAIHAGLKRTSIWVKREAEKLTTNQ